MVMWRAKKMDKESKNYTKKENKTKILAKVAELRDMSDDADGDDDNDDVFVKTTLLEF